MRPQLRQDGTTDDERGVTIVEYALLVSLIMIGTLTALGPLSDTAADGFEARGDHVGNPNGLTPTG